MPRTIAILITMILLPSLIMAGNPGREGIIFDISKKHYKYYRAEYPLSKGNQFFTLSIGYLESGGDLYNLNRDNMSRFGTDLNYGYFVKDNLSLGLTVDYSLNSHKGERYRFFSIGPQLTAFYEHDSLFGFPFLRIGPLFTSRSGNGGLSGIGFSGEVGYSYFVSRNYAAEVVVGYAYSILEPAGGSVTGGTVKFQIGMSRFIF